MFKLIKDEQGIALRNLDGIKEQWKGYFDKLLNDDNQRSAFEDGVPNEGLAIGMRKISLSRMRMG